ncbi:hypothetical protein F5Y15DRAFT_412586 [Xylariaceae sp. FL0016]|nr:hypothetical protein F5Y15DRAFT_412586 [Xylariaceae sp. FL0016]
MMRALIFPALTSISVASKFNIQYDYFPSQKPLSDASSPAQPISTSPWKLNFTSPAPHLFASVSSLLQQWSNTFFPNGHTLAAVQIPAHTLLYHGRLDADPPPSPEWLAFDLAMSYGIMGGSPNSHMLTYQTTRPVRALYFDGESAALMGLGQLDTQMLHIWGNVSGPERDGGGFRGLWEEYARAHGLCDWLLESGLRGEGWGFEGVVRMNAAFEVIWCNFTSPSLRLLTHLNVTAPALPKEGETDDGSGYEDEDENFDGIAVHLNPLPTENNAETSYYSLPPVPTRTDSSSGPSHPPMPPNWRGGREPSRDPFLKSESWGWFSSATHHYGASRNGPGPGEVRAKVLGCGIISYYSPKYHSLATLRGHGEQLQFNLTEDGYWKGPGSASNRTLALQDLTRRRRYHHLENATTDEAAYMRHISREALRGILRNEANCSGADWPTMANEITQSATVQLQEMTIALSAYWQMGQLGRNQSALKSWLSDVRSQSHMFLVGFLEYPTTDDLSAWDTDSGLFNATYARCRYRYTRLMASPGSQSLHTEEKDLIWAVEETFGAICSVLLTIGFGIEKAWAQHFQRPKSKRSVDTNLYLGQFGEMVATWIEGIEELKAWLGWADQFTGCTEVCAWNERCYIPMWPLIGFTGGPRGPPPGNGTRPPPGEHHWPPPPHDPHQNHTGDAPSLPPRNRRPSWNFGETDLWEPKCIKASYFMHDR